MMLQIPGVLSGAELTACHGIIDAAPWVDGKVTAGPQSGAVKDNIQLPEESEAARRAGQLVLAALDRSPLFLSAALPLKVYPPLFNCYRKGHGFGAHVDNAVRMARSLGVRVRTDLSATLFLTDPAEYDGGELVVEDTYGLHSVKLPAGDMILFPASSLHHVTPVTRGARISSFFWLQSMVRDDAARRMLFELDQTIQSLYGEVPDSPSLVHLTGLYHNLVRRWADS